MASYAFLAVRALAVVVIAASVWPFLDNPYNGFVARMIGGLAPEEIGVRAAYGRFYLDFLSEASGTGLNIHGFVLHFGPILVLALIAATPSLGLIRLAVSLAGAAALFVVLHVVGLLLFVWGLWWALQDDGAGVTTGGVMAAFAIFWALLPAVIGGAWCYRYWLPFFRSSGRPGSNAAGDALQGRDGQVDQHHDRRLSRYR